MAGNIEIKSYVHKRELTVRAIQVSDNNVYSLVKSYYPIIKFGESYGIDGAIEVLCYDGSRKIATIGDYLIVDEEGDFAVISKDYFENDYVLKGDNK